MKRIACTLFALLVAMAGYSQEKYFELTPDGFVSNNPEKPGYILVEYPEVSQADLYNAVLMAIGDVYVSPEDVVSKVENKQITVNGFEKEVIQRTKFHLFNINYTIVFEFRDGLVRVNAPSVNKISAYNDKEQIMYVCGPGNDGFGNQFNIFNKKGELKNERAKQSVEEFLNYMVAQILAKTNTKTTDEEW